MKILTDMAEWEALNRHHHDLNGQQMRDWFTGDNTRFARFSLQSSGIFLDYSRNRIDHDTIALLCNLAHATGLRKKIDSLFSGLPINTSEKRPALHTALRDKGHQSVIVNGKNIAPIIAETYDKMQQLAAKIHDRKWLGTTGKPIRHIVNVGIGGSHLGPMMTTQALRDFAVADLQIHFISTIDKAHLNDVWAQIDPETTLFIVSSKSFTTLETTTNVNTIAARMTEKLGPDAIKKHFIAVTAATQKAIEFGIPEDQIFPIWDWVGGRYSIWSAIGLPLMLMIGSKQFDEFLAGAYEMDQHFQHTDFAANMPVLLALLGIWYTNFFGASTQAIIPYSHRLRHFISYLQQAEMESNGKNINLSGNGIRYATGSVIFGEEGNNGQHAYHQLLHQGQHLIPVDFILVGKTSDDADNHHDDILLASGLSQAEALMRGKSYEEAFSMLLAANYAEQDAIELAHHQVTPGNRPSNILFLEKITPKNLGALIALYEHKIFVQGVIWNINSFDQWGVELGKQLLPNILQRVQGAKSDEKSDAATAKLIHLFRKNQGQT